jgi:hypothetical protein
MENGMNRKQQIALIAEYDNILEELGNNPSEDYLDNLLLIFSEQMSLMPTLTTEQQDSMRIQTLELLESETSIKVKKSLLKIHKVYKDDSKISINESKQLLNTLENDIKNIANNKEICEDIEMKYIDDEDFRKFLSILIANMRNKDDYKIIRLGKQHQLPDNKIKVQERLNHYFNEPKITESIKNDRTTWDIPKSTINYFWQGVRNKHLDQSQTNRAKSLYNSGASLEESIKTIIPNKSRQREIHKLVVLNQEKANQLNKSRKRLY